MIRLRNACYGCDGRGLEEGWRCTWRYIPLYVFWICILHRNICIQYTFGSRLRGRPIENAGNIVITSKVFCHASLSFFDNKFIEKNLMDIYFFSCTFLYNFFFIAYGSRSRGRHVRECGEHRKISIAKE